MGYFHPKDLDFISTNQKKTWAERRDFAAQKTQGDLRQGSLRDLVERRWRWMPNPKGEITSFLPPKIG